MQGAAALMIGYSAAMAGFAFTRVLAYALVAQFVIGWTYFALMTGLQTMIQSIVDESKRGRVMSLFQVCWAGLIPWGGLAMGKSAAEFGVTTTLGAAAGICGFYGIGVWLWARGAVSAEVPASEGGLY